jgi:hypothetical protein
MGGVLNPCAASVDRGGVGTASAGPAPAAGADGGLRGAGAATLQLCGMGMNNCKGFRMVPFPQGSGLDGEISSVKFDALGRCRSMQILSTNQFGSASGGTGITCRDHCAI